MRFFPTLDLDPANVDANGLCALLPVGTSWTLAGDAEFIALSAGDSLAHRLVVTTAGNEPAGNGAVLTIVGTDADDNAITEDVTLPNATTAETVKYFKTIASTLTTDVATIDTVDLGWVDEVSSPSIKLDGSNLSNWYLDVTGTLSIDVHFTTQNPHQFYDQETAPWQAAIVASLDAETADAHGELAAGWAFARVLFNSYTDTAELQVYTSQPDGAV